MRSLIFNGINHTAEHYYVVFIILPRLEHDDSFDPFIDLLDHLYIL